VSDPETDRVQVVDWDASWLERFNREESVLRALLGDELRALHHVGSTSVPGLCAKPVVDILLEVHDLDGLDARAPALDALGLKEMGEYGIAGRRYFDGRRTRGVHLHAFVSGSLGGRRHLAFRDYLRTHPEVARSYGLLKRSLAARFPLDRSAYSAGKDSFVSEHESLALQWLQRQPG